MLEKLADKFERKVKCLISTLCHGDSSMIVCSKLQMHPRLSRVYMGYWPSVRSRWLDVGQKPSHLDQTNLIDKGFIIWLSGKFFLWDTAGSPERARWLHLACSGSQSHRAIWFIQPAHRANIISVVTALVAAPLKIWRTAVLNDRQLYIESNMLSYTWPKSFLIILM